MPSGGNIPLKDDDWEYVKGQYEDACKHGLQYEYLQWFIGGLVNNKKNVRDASYSACIEWDF